MTHVLLQMSSPYNIHYQFFLSQIDEKALMGTDLVTIASLQIDLITEEGYSCNFPSLPSIRSVQNTKHATQDKNKSNGAHQISLSANEKHFPKADTQLLLLG